MQLVDKFKKHFKNRIHKNNDGGDSVTKIGSLSVISSPSNEITVFINNDDPINSYVYRLFGGNTGLPAISGNTRYLKNKENVTVGNAPGYSAISPINNNLFIVNHGSGSVTVINTVTNNTITDISVGNNPSFVFAANGFMYVSNANSNTISCIDPTSNTVIASINGSTSPFCFGSNASGSKIYVTDQFDTSLTIINTNTNTVINTLTLPNLGRLSVLAGGYLYIGSFSDNRVTVVDTVSDTIVTTITVGSTPYNLFLNNGIVYANNVFGGGISVIDPNTNTVIHTIPVGGSPYWTAFNPATNLMYVTDLSGNITYVINYLTNTIITSIASSGTTPLFVIFSALFNVIFVGNNGTGTIDVIDVNTNQFINTVVADPGTHFGIQAPDGNVYFSNNGSNTATTIDYAIPVVSTGLSQTNTNGAFNPIIINSFVLDTNSVSNIQVPLEKFLSSSAGGNNNIFVSLIGKRTSFETPGFNIAHLKRKDFSDPILDGTRYIQHVIAPNSTIAITIKYDEVITPYGSDSSAKPILIEDIGQRRTKKYSTASV